MKDDTQPQDDSPVVTQKGGGFEAVMCLVVAVCAFAAIIGLAPAIESYSARKVASASKSSHERAVNRAEKEIRAESYKEAVSAEARARVVLDK